MEMPEKNERNLRLKVYPFIIFHFYLDFPLFQQFSLSLQKLIHQRIQTIVNSLSPNGLAALYIAETNALLLFKRWHAKEGGEGDVKQRYPARIKPLPLHTKYMHFLASMHIWPLIHQDAPTTQCNILCHIQYLECAWFNQIILFIVCIEAFINSQEFTFTLFKLCRRHTGASIEKKKKKNYSKKLRGSPVYGVGNRNCSSHAEHFERTRHCCPLVVEVQNGPFHPLTVCSGESNQILYFSKSTHALMQMYNITSKKICTQNST